jgi:tRNA(fMet)-specific endonuclease VapC
MNDVLVDTDVVSYLYKRDSRARKLRRHLFERRWLISFMTLAELDLWALKRNWGEPLRAKLGRYLQRFGLIYPDRNLCGWWAEVVGRAGSVGRPISTADAWIAATALAYDLPLVTNNKQDYIGVHGLEILSDTTPR